MESRNDPSPAAQPESDKLAVSLPVEPVLYSASLQSEPLRQGEILSGVLQRLRTVKSLLPNQKPELAEMEHPFAIVVSQDCDLLTDFEFRKTSQGIVQESSHKVLPNTLLCEVVTLEDFLARVPKGRDIWKRIIENKDERYHVLQQVPQSEDLPGHGLPSLGIDFRRYFSIRTEELYIQLEMGVSRRCRLNSPYLEHFSSRFAAYLSRIALPKDHRI